MRRPERCCIGSGCIGSVRIAAVAADIGPGLGAAGSTVVVAEPIVVAVHIALVVVVTGSTVAVRSVVMAAVVVPTALDSVRYS